MMSSRRPACVLSFTLVSALLLSSCASVSHFTVANLPADLRGSAACIATVLLETPGITAVQISARPDQDDASLGDIPPGDERNSTIAVVTYKYATDNTEQTVSFGLFKDPRLGSPGIVFNWGVASGFGASDKDGPVTLAVAGKFEDRCHALGILRT